MTRLKSKICAVRKQNLETDFVLLLLRLSCGFAFMHHGWGKIQNPFHWMGNEAGMPGALQALAAFSEFAGGFALCLGLLTRLGAFGIACTMGVALYLHIFVFGDPFVSVKGGHSYELPAAYFLIALLLMLQGAGRFSLDRFIA